MQEPSIEFTQHALDFMAQREIPVEWAERVVANPRLRVQDPRDPQVERLYGEIEEFGNRVLRVAVNTHVSPWRVVTAFFDGRMRADYEAKGG